MGACESNVNKPSNYKRLPSDGEYNIKPPDEWTVNDVYNWLLSAGLYCAATKFKQHNINGQTMLAITDQHLNQIGISIHYKHRFESLRSALITKHKKNNLSQYIPSQTALTQINHTSSSLTSISISTNTETSTPYHYPRKLSIQRLPSDVSMTMPPLPELIQTPSDWTDNTDHAYYRNDTETKLDDTVLTEMTEIIDDCWSSIYTLPGLQPPHYTQSQPPETPKNVIVRCSDTSNNDQYHLPNTSNDKQSHNNSNDNNNNDDNDNTDNGSNGCSGGDDENNEDEDKNKKSDKNHNDDDKTEENEDEEDEKDESNASYLNKNAPPFIPNPSPLPTIDETEKSGTPKMESLSSDSVSDSVANNMNNNKPKKKSNNKSKKNKVTKKLDPFSSIRAKGNVQISRALTDKIIPKKVRESIENLYLYIDNTTILNCNEEYNDGKIRIFNYDFHDKQTGEILYCIAEKQDASKNRGYCWRMTNNLWTADEIKSIYGIKQNVLPKSKRISKGYVERMRYIKNIGDELKNVIKHTKWNNVHVFGTTNNQQRITLSLTLEKFVKHMTTKENMDNKEDMIPILVSNNKCYDVEYIKIIRILLMDNHNGKKCNEQMITQRDSVNIAISFGYNEKQQRITATGIYLNKQDIVNMHQLAAPDHECKCLDDFKWNIINTLHIGNPDDILNKWKAAKNEIQKFKKERIEHMDEIKALKLEIEELRKDKDTESKNNDNMDTTNNVTTPLSTKHLQININYPEITPHASMSTNPSYSVLTSNTPSILTTTSLSDTPIYSNNNGNNECSTD